jgi:hypothetical protein
MQCWSCRESESSSSARFTIVSFIPGPACCAVGRLNYGCFACCSFVGLFGSSGQYDLALPIPALRLTCKSSLLGPALGVATIADIFKVDERGKPISIYALGPMAGPILGSEWVGLGLIRG